jgi:hypothetical protein
MASLDQQPSLSRIAGGNHHILAATGHVGHVNQPIAGRKPAWLNVALFCPRRVQ